MRSARASRPLFTAGGRDHILPWPAAPADSALPHRRPLSDALRQQLQALLGTAYTLERELGGGGMSRVFLAREEALGRDVVVKVLAP